MLATDALVHAASGAHDPQREGSQIMIALDVQITALGERLADIAGRMKEIGMELGEITGEAQKLRPRIAQESPSLLPAWTELVQLMRAAALALQRVPMPEPPK
jgi:hypothetical protein